jgi:hypothetical protein
MMMMMNNIDKGAVLKATATIQVPIEAARAWFLSLAEHPERYQFESHKGFVFTQGEFGEPGARFQTEEFFHGVKITLKFELTEVTERRFTFVVTSPTRGIWGYFALETVQAQGKPATRLWLVVGSDQRVQRAILSFPLVRNAVQQQIQGEVDHIKDSIESLTTNR